MLLSVSEGVLQKASVFLAMNRLGARAIRRFRESVLGKYRGYSCCEETGCTGCLVKDTVSAVVSDSFLGKGRGYSRNEEGGCTGTYKTSKSNS